MFERIGRWMDEHVIDLILHGAQAILVVFVWYSLIQTKHCADTFAFLFSLYAICQLLLFITAAFAVVYDRPLNFGELKRRWLEYNKYVVVLSVGTFVALIRLGFC